MPASMNTRKVMDLYRSTRASNDLNFSQEELETIGKNMVRARNLLQMDQTLESGQEKKASITGVMIRYAAERSEAEMAHLFIQSLENMLHHYRTKKHEEFPPGEDTGNPFHSHSLEAIKDSYAEVKKKINSLIYNSGTRPEDRASRSETVMDNFLGYLSEHFDTYVAKYRHTNAHDRKDLSKHSKVTSAVNNKRLIKLYFKDLPKSIKAMLKTYWDRTLSAIEKDTSSVILTDEIRKKLHPIRVTTIDASSLRGGAGSIPGAFAAIVNQIGDYHITDAKVFEEAKIEDGEHVIAQLSGEKDNMIKNSAPFPIQVGKTYNLLPFPAGSAEDKGARSWIGLVAQGDHHQLGPDDSVIPDEELPTALSYFVNLYLNRPEVKLELPGADLLGGEADRGYDPDEDVVDSGGHNLVARELKELFEGQGHVRDFGHMAKTLVKYIKSLEDTRKEQLSPGFIKAIDQFKEERAFTLSPEAEEAYLSGYKPLKELIGNLQEPKDGEHTSAATITQVVEAAIDSREVAKEVMKHFMDPERSVVSLGTTYKRKDGTTYTKGISEAGIKNQMALITLLTLSNTNSPAYRMLVDSAMPTRPGKDGKVKFISGDSSAIHNTKLAEASKGRIKAMQSLVKQAIGKSERFKEAVLDEIGSLDESYTSDHKEYSKHPLVSRLFNAKDLRKGKITVRLDASPADFMQFFFHQLDAKWLTSFSGGNEKNKELYDKVVRYKPEYSMLFDDLVLRLRGPKKGTSSKDSAEDKAWDRASKKLDTVFLTMKEKIKEGLNKQALPSAKALLKEINEDTDKSPLHALTNKMDLGDITSDALEEYLDDPDTDAMGALEDAYTKMSEDERKQLKTELLQDARLYTRIGFLVHDWSFGDLMRLFRYKYPVEAKNSLDNLLKLRKVYQTVPRKIQNMIKDNMMKDEGIMHDYGDILKGTASLKPEPESMRLPKHASNNSSIVNTILYRIRLIGEL